MKNIIAYSFILFFAGISLVSCLGDLDTMPLDDNQLVSEKVYWILHIKSRNISKQQGLSAC